MNIGIYGVGLYYNNDSLSWLSIINIALLSTRFIIKRDTK